MNREQVKEVRDRVGNCQYCESSAVRWFCPYCWKGICDDCMEEGKGVEVTSMGKCAFDCFNDLPDLLGIDLLADFDLKIVKKKK